MTPQQVLHRQEALATEMGDLVRQIRMALSAMNEPAEAQHTALSPFLAGRQWNKVAARGAVGVLLRYKDRRHHLAYRDLHRELVAAGAPEDIGTMQKYSKALDQICRAFQGIRMRGQPVPLLTALVVNDRHKLPSQGLNPHLRNWLVAIERDDLAAQVSDEEVAPIQILKLATEAVFDFPHWDGAIAVIGLTGDPAADMARD